MMHFTVEEENLICMYHNADRRRTIGNQSIFLQKPTARNRGADGCGDLSLLPFNITHIHSIFHSLRVE